MLSFDFMVDLGEEPPPSPSWPLQIVHRNGDEVGVFGQGKLDAMRCFFAFELTKIDAWLAVAARREALVRELCDDAF